VNVEALSQRKPASELLNLAAEPFNQIIVSLNPVNRLLYGLVVT
jgi:hypothetical protein